MRTSSAAIAMVLVLSIPCAAQTVPFFSSSPTAFEPQISVAAGGSLMNGAATVSQNRKYVTIAAQPATMTAPAELHPFTFVSGSGFVGMSVLADINTPKQAQVMPTSILDRPGMTLVSPLSP